MRAALAAALGQVGAGWKLLAIGWVLLSAGGSSALGTALFERHLAREAEMALWNSLALALCSLRVLANL